MSLLEGPRGDGCPFGWIDEGHLEAAAAAYDAAEKLLGDRPLENGKATRDLWLEIMLAGRAQLYIHLRRPELAGAVLSAVRPVLEANGPGSQLYILYRYLAWKRAVERRWQIDEQVIEYARVALASAKEVGEDADVYREKGPATAWAAYFLGAFLSPQQGHLDEAEEQVMGSLSLADRSGDLILRAICLSNLAAVALRRHDTDAVRSLAGELFRPAEAPGTKCCKWMFIWPLVAVRLQEGMVAQAVMAARVLLEPSQQRFPEELQSLVESASLSWDKDEADIAKNYLALAVEKADELRFF